MNEKEIKYLMDKYQLTRDEAVQMWREDNGLEENAEIEEMTAKAKEIRRYEKADKPKSKSKKERKVDTVKLFIIEVIQESLQQLEQFENIEIVNPEREIAFTIGKDNYSITLTKHRPKK